MELQKEIKCLPNEEWRDVKGFENIYAISDHGRLASNKGGWHILSNVNSKGGYFSVVLQYVDEIRYTRIHRIVYETFVGDIPKGHKFHVHHINHDKQDNRVENLELISCAQHNIKHFKENPHIIDGMNNHNKYVRPKKVVQCDLCENVIAIYPNAKEASISTGVCQRNILQVANKEPYNKRGSTRKQAGGYIWKFEE